MQNQGFVRRLTKELKTLNTDFCDTFQVTVVCEKSWIWHISFLGPEGSVYAGERYTLQFKFVGNYPFEAPEVMFVGEIPHHEHVYKCGYICLSTLDSDWTPALQTSSVCMSIISMMASAK